jgi:hypothetical protein
MKFEELEKVVNIRTAQLWEDPKQAQLIQYTFPFMAFSDRTVEAMLQGIITNRLPKQLFNTAVRISVTPQAVRYGVIYWICMRFYWRFCSRDQGAINHFLLTFFSWMRSKVVNYFANENGRGVDKYIENTIVPFLLRQTRDFVKKSSGFSVLLDIENDDLSLRYVVINIILNLTRDRQRKGPFWDDEF